MLTKVEETATSMQAVMMPTHASLSDIEAARREGFRRFHLQCASSPGAVWESTTLYVAKSSAGQVRTRTTMHTSPLIQQCVDMVSAAADAYTSDLHTSGRRLFGKSSSSGSGGGGFFSSLFGGGGDDDSISTMGAGEADAASSASGLTSAATDTASYIAQNEGTRLSTYTDSMGVPTIGVGSNLNEQANQDYLSNAGYDVDKVMSGQQSITQDDAMGMLQNSMGTAQSDAQNFAGSDAWDSMSSGQKTALTDMSYQLGSNRLGGFKNMQADIQSGDWQGAADEMGDSSYCNQVPSRCASNQALFTGS
jgi:GH24 family phage-related lysozyme (muramidase)